MGEEMAGSTSSHDLPLDRDYEAAREVFTTLTNIRFRLVALVPSIAGATVALLPEKAHQESVLAVALLGFFATFGVLVYELRNSEHYNAAIHRAKFLEGELGLPLATKRQTRESGGRWPSAGGLFNERPFVPKKGEEGFRLFRFVPLQHEVGLALVYGAAFGGWAYLVAHAVLVLSWRAGRTTGLLALVPAVLVGVAVLHEVVRHDKSPQMKMEPAEPADTAGRSPA